MFKKISQTICEYIYFVTLTLNLSRKFSMCINLVLDTLKFTT